MAIILVGPRELLPPHIGRCQSSATLIFQPPSSCRTTTSSQHGRPSGVLRRRSNGLECAAWRPPRPVAQCRQFPEEARDASVSECTWTLSALEALHNALYKFKTYLLTYQKCTWTSLQHRQSLCPMPVIHLNCANMQKMHLRSRSRPIGYVH